MRLIKEFDFLEEIEELIEEQKWDFDEDAWWNYFCIGNDTSIHYVVGTGYFPAIDKALIELGAEKEECVALWFSW